MPPKLLKQMGYQVFPSLMLLLIGCQGKTPEETQTTPVVSLPVVDLERQNISVFVNMTGTAIAPPNTSAKISPAVAGKLAAVNVVPGQQVGKGQVIARLDSRQITEQVNQATAALRSSQAGVVQARTNLDLAQKNLQQQRQLYSPDGSTPALRQAQAGVAQARTNLDLAKKTLQQQRQLYSPDGSTPALRQAQAGVEQAKANLVLAINSLERSRLLYKEKIAPKKDLIAAENQVSVAQSQLKLATATVEQVIPQKDLIAAQNQVQVAVAQLTTAQAQVEQIIPKKDLLAAENQVQVAESQLAAAIAQQQQASASRQQVQTQLSFTEIRSPIAGIVASRLLNTGDTTDPATPVVQVVNLSKVIINASLPADNKANIRIGQIANIRSLIGGNYSGVVTAVSPIVDPQSNTRSIQISVGNSGGQLKENQTVSVSITTDIHSAAITVPQTALVPDPENPAGRMIYIVKDGKMERKKVETGIQQKDNVEILSGLVGNERVVAKGAYGLEDGTAIKEVKQ